MLRDCIEKDPVDNELFILVSPDLFEGFRDRRSRFTQALLEIEGQFAMGDSLVDTFGNYPIQCLIAALGIGVDMSMGNREGMLDASKIRYFKILIVAQREDRAVVDEIVRFFNVFMGPVVEAGHLYVLDPSVADGLLTDEALNPGRPMWRQVERSASPPPDPYVR